QLDAFSLNDALPIFTAAIAALSLAVPLWLAALIVSVVVFAIAGASALFGRSKVKAAGSFAPRRTLDSLKQDVTEVKERGTHERRSEEHTSELKSRFD